MELASLEYPVKGLSCISVIILICLTQRRSQDPMF